jgi:phosphatidylglycerol lysyltransferase
MRRKHASPPACEHFSSQAELPCHLTARLRQLAIEHGDTYASYLVTEPDREYFWNDDHHGVVGFRRRGRYLTVADGLLAAPEDRPQLLADFLAFTKANRWHVTFVNVPRNEINVFRNLGCQVSKCGEEPVVRLQRATWKGKDWEWVRRQENYCKRQGVEFREVTHQIDDTEYRESIAPQLEQISQEHVASTLHRREMKFFVSQFNPAELRDRRLFIAEEQGRVTAFIVCNPGLAGDMWAVEVYRRRHDAVRGVVPSLMMHAMRTMQAEGVSYFSLSLAPFVRCTPVAGDSPMFRKVVNFWWRFLNPIYDVHGMFHFKSRFRPDYREMFVAANPPLSVRSLVSLSITWQLFHFNPLRLLARSIRQRGNAERRLLVTPDRANECLLRDLRPKAQRPAELLLAAVDTLPAAQHPAAQLLAHEEVSA